MCTPWATTADLCSPCLENLADYDVTLVEDALLTASEILYQFTRQRWPGWCEDTVRPTARYASPDTMRHYGTLDSRMVSRAETFGANAELLSSLIAGFAGGALLCNCRDQHQVGCSYISQITLGEVPITGIVQVKIDGDVVDAARYRVDDYRWLVWMPDQSGVDTRSGWPCCQRMDLPTTEDGTFEVTYTVGTPPSRGGVRAAAVLACQFILAWTPGGAGSCKLPKRVTSMTRQQVSMNLTDPVALFDKGLTGISEVDLWVQGVNRAVTHRGGAVVVPERRRQSVRRRTS